MIRHSSSFLFSIIVHTVLFFILLFIFNSYIKRDDKKLCEKRICVKLCNIQCEKDIKKPKEKPTIKPKPKPKLKPEIKLKPIIKPKEKQKIKKSQVQKKIIENFSKSIIEKIKIQKSIQIEPVKFEKKVINNIKEYKPSPQELSQEYMQDNIAKIVKLLQDNLYYPRRARKKSITGEVLVKFTLCLDAKVKDVVVLKSNKEILSRAAIKTIKDLSGEFPKPEKELSISVPIAYSLN